MNIAKGTEWIRRRRTSEPLLTRAVVCELHERMFADPWTWAGRFRTSLENIGVLPEDIPEQLHNLPAGVTYWIDYQTYPITQIGCRFHHRLVAIHPFPNGNGRHARIMTDALLRKLGTELFTWGSGSIDDADTVRERYITALREADSRNYAPLIAFVRS